MMSSFLHPDWTISACHFVLLKLLKSLKVSQVMTLSALSVSLTMRYALSTAGLTTQEIGSLTSQGADSNFLPTILSRLSSLSASNNSNGSATVFEESLSKSFLISADMAHAVHPNYSTKYEDKHKPKLNQGVVLKVAISSFNY